jgi:FtsP/CotA-like multicopper oxidase with cupredoxin domain
MNEPQSRSLSARAAVALLLTAGLTTWWWVVPPAVLAGRGWVGGLIALPLAIVAVAVVGGRPWSLPKRAGAIAGLFVALLLVTGPLHGAVRNGLQPEPPQPNLAAIRYDTACPSMFKPAECPAAADAATVSQAHHAMMTLTGHSAADHAAMNSPFYPAAAGRGPDVMAYAIQDAFLALLVALPLILLGLYLAGRIRQPVGLRVPRLLRTRSRWVAATSAVGLVVVGAVTVTAWPASAAVTPFATALTIPPVLTGANIDIRMRQTGVQIMPTGPATQMWTYAGIFPGPTIRRPSGQTTRVTFHNDLPVTAGETTVHNHGNHSVPAQDGQPNTQLIPTGGQHTYVYEGREAGQPERAVTQWYHDHRMDVTGRNVWNGLVGMFILDDPVDSALPLPKGQYDVPLTITDRTFDANNQIPYNFNILGTLGDTWLVNGKPQPYFNVADRKYRIRILNAANRRPLVLALSNGAAMTQIATESGLLPAPVQRTSIIVQPAERVEIVVDFNALLGQNVVLLDTNTPATPGNPPHELMQFRVNRDVPGDTSSVPATLRPAPTFPAPVKDRQFVLRAVVDANGAPTQWTINNQTFDPNRIDADPVLNTTERWTFMNISPQPHAIHLHDVDWRLVNRFQVVLDAAGNPTAGTPIPIQPYEDGLKETFFVPANTGISVTTTFSDRVGEYVFHCHMLEHEDMAMMGRFVVRPPT